LIADEAAAVQYRFRGSPTVTVGDEDVDPRAGGAPSLTYG